MLVPLLGLLRRALKLHKLWLGLLCHYAIAGGRGAQSALVYLLLLVSKFLGTVGRVRFNVVPELVVRCRCEVLIKGGARCGLLQIWSAGLSNPNLRDILPQITLVMLLKAAIIEVSFKVLQLIGLITTLFIPGVHHLNIRSQMSGHSLLAALAAFVTVASISGDFVATSVHSHSIADLAIS